MSNESELREALLDGYTRAGQEVGYWAHRFRQSVIRNGALATLKRMLRPRNASERKGLDKFLEAGRPDLTVEAILLQPKFQPLFTDAELDVARQRLGDFAREAKRRTARRESLYPDELEPGLKYRSGVKKQVRVNAYERDRRARSACLRHHGFRCAACDLLMEERYGAVGRKFIHVHHLKPLALVQ